PGLAGRSCCLREHLTVLVRTGEAAEVPTLSGARAGNEERHLALLGIRDVCSGEPQQHQRSQDRPTHSVHVHPPVAFGVGAEYRLTSGEAIESLVAAFWMISSAPSVLLWCWGLASGSAARAPLRGARDQPYRVGHRRGRSHSPCAGARIAI